MAPYTSPSNAKKAGKKSGRPRPLVKKVMKALSDPSHRKWFQHGIRSKEFFKNSTSDLPLDSSSRRGLEEASPPHSQDGENRQISGRREVPPSTSTTRGRQSTRAAKTNATALAPMKTQEREQVRSRQTSGGGARRMLMPSELSRPNTLDHGGYEQSPQNVRDRDRVAPVLVHPGMQTMGYPPITSTLFNGSQFSSSSYAQYPTQIHGGFPPAVQSMGYPLLTFAASNVAQVPSSYRAQSSPRNQADRRPPHISSRSASRYSASRLSQGQISPPCQEGFFDDQLSPSTASSSHSFTAWVPNPDQSLGLQTPPAISVSSSGHSPASPPLLGSGPSHQERVLADQFYPFIPSSAHPPTTYMLDPNRPSQTPGQYRGQFDAPSISSSSHSPNSSYSPAPSPQYPANVTIRYDILRQDISNASPSVGQQGPDHRQAYESALDGIGDLSLDPQSYRVHEGYSNTTGKYD